MLTIASQLFQRTLEFICIFILLSLAGVVLLAVVFRYSGNSLVWYDEVASIQLAWLTYFGAAYAAFHRSHLGFAGLLMKLPGRLRLAIFLAAEVLVIAFFASIAWAGYIILGVVATETLVGLPEVSLAFTQSVLPVGCALFIVAQLFSVPEAWRNVAAGVKAEQGNTKAGNGGS